MKARKKTAKILQFPVSQRPLAPQLMKNHLGPNNELERDTKKVGKDSKECLRKSKDLVQEAEALLRRTKKAVEA